MYENDRPRYITKIWPVDMIRYVCRYD